MFSLLSQPYPTEESVRRRLVRAFLIGAFVGLFLLVFQPFGLHDWQTPAKWLKILGFGLITFGVLIADSLLMPFLFSRYFSDDHWTVGREVVRIMLFILAIAVGNRLYLGWLLGEPPTAGGWLRAIGMTFLIGIFPTIGAVLASYIVQLRRYAQTATGLSNYSVPTPKELLLRERVSAVRQDDALNQTIRLVADNERDTLSLCPNTLLFIESSDNYCTVVYLRRNLAGEDQIVKPLLRSSLSRLEAQIAGKSDLGQPDPGEPYLQGSLHRYPHHPHVVRCHRSYIVNLDRVERVTGNAQGYKLHFFDGQFQVPVARRFNDKLIRQLKSLA